MYIYIIYIQQKQPLFCVNFHLPLPAVDDGEDDGEDDDSANDPLEQFLGGQPGGRSMVMHTL